MEAFLIKYTVLLVIGIFLATRIYERHYIGANGKLFKAWHIGLPGYDTYYCPEQTVELKDWVGTQEDGLKGIIDGQENPEITAGPVSNYTIGPGKGKAFFGYRIRR